MSCATSTTSSSRYLSESNRFAERIMVADDHGAGNKRHDEWAPTRPPTQLGMVARRRCGSKRARQGQEGSRGRGRERGVRGGSWMTGGGSVVMATHRSAAATRIESSRGHIAPRHTTPHHTTPRHATSRHATPHHTTPYHRGYVCVRLACTKPR